MNRTSWFLQQILGLVQDEEEVIVILARVYLCLD